MKVGIFTPYLDILGGGERYILTIASSLSEKGYQVDIFWDDEKIKKDIKERLGLDLGKTKFIEDIFSPSKNLIQKRKITSNYDLFFYISDGSVPFLFGKKNFLCFMAPFTGVNGQSFLNKIKLVRIHRVISISKFTKRFIDKEYGVRSVVVYPPVEVEDFNPGKKENLILSVGRFTQTLHDKKQHILVEVFKQINKEGLKDWRLVLAGGMVDEGKKYVEDLGKLVKGYPIEIKPNINLSELKQYYKKAKIYWHAAGFGENEQEHPEKMEHFGITTVEGMSAGAVPIVINKGGQPEIVKHQTNGFLWETKEELAKYTLRLIAESRSKVKSENLWEKLSKQAIKDSQKFSKKVFCKRIDEIIED